MGVQHSASSTEKVERFFAAFILSPCIQLDNPSTSDTFRSYVTFACENILSPIVFPCHHNAVIPDSDAPLFRSLYT